MKKKKRKDSEQILGQLLSYLTESVFVRSTNSVTGRVEELNPAILDMEGTIRICGEWDREDLKMILTKITSNPYQI